MEMFIDACAKFGDKPLRNIQEVHNSTNKKKKFTKIPLSPLVMWCQNHFNWHVNDLVRFSQLQNAQ